MASAVMAEGGEVAGGLGMGKAASA